MAKIVLKDAFGNRFDVGGGSGEEKKLMYIGNVEQSSVAADGKKTSSAIRVCSADAVAIPFSAVKIKVNLPEGIVVGLRTGSRIENLNVFAEGREYWLSNGDTYQFAVGNNYYRFIFARAGATANIFATDIAQYIASESISMEILNADEEGNVITRNTEAEKVLKAAMWDRTGGLPSPYFTSKGLNGYPVIAHLTDCHADYQRIVNFYEYAKFIGVDAVALTGDYYGNNIKDGMSHIENIINKYNIMTCACLGNHDVLGLSSESAIYNTSFKFFADKFNYTMSGSVGYSYKDIATNDGKGLRIISLNHYENGGTTMSATQINWLIATLASTPTNYGVIILTHAPLVALSSIEGKEPFCQAPNQNGWIWNPISQGTLITQIVDAFVSKENKSVGGYTVNFASVNSGVEFICFLNGHEHEDYVGYITSTANRLLHINATCSQSVYGIEGAGYQANLSDIPRGGKGSTQDSFNMYVIDRPQKKIRIVRIGSNVNKDMKDRKFLELDY